MRSGVRRAGVLPCTALDGVRCERVLCASRRVSRGERTTFRRACIADASCSGCRSGLSRPPQDCAVCVPPAGSVAPSAAAAPAALLGRARWAGRHRRAALPACVFCSRLSLLSFDGSSTPRAGLVDNRVRPSVQYPRLFLASKGRSLSPPTALEAACTPAHCRLTNWGSQRPAVLLIPPRWPCTPPCSGLPRGSLGTDGGLRTLRPRGTWRRAGDGQATAGRRVTV